MGCFHPLTIPNPAKTVQVLGRDSHIVVPCGKCIGCKQDYTNSYAHRLMEECKDAVQVVFVTLTYAPEFLPEGNVLVKKDLQAFLKRFNTKMRNYYRIAPGTRTMMPYTYAACGEYGDEFGRAHYHVILFFKAINPGWNYPVKWSDIRNCWCKYNRKTKKYVPFGRVQIELPRSEESISGYIAKYSCKQLFEEYPDKQSEPFSLRSQKLGIGYLWREGPALYHRAISSFKNMKGFRIKLHRYYLTKLYGSRPLQRSEEEQFKCFIIRERAKQKSKEYEAKQWHEYIMYHPFGDWSGFEKWRDDLLIAKEREKLRRAQEKEKKRVSSKHRKGWDTKQFLYKQVFA